jgi:hypothetical protein
MRISVNTPTTPAVIHAPCHKLNEVLLVLETPLGYPKPLSLAVEHEVSATVVRLSARASLNPRLNCMGVSLSLGLVAVFRER